MRAEVTPEQAISLAETLFDCAASSAHPLAGYDDANFLLEGPSGRFVLKVINSADSAAEGFSEAQSALMLFLADRGVAVPRALPLVAAAGGAAPSYTAYIAGQQPGVKHAVRLLTYLPGTLLKDADQSLALYTVLGAFMARIDRLLAGWDHPALHRQHVWNLDCLPATYAATRPVLESLPSLDLALLDAVVAHFEQQTAPLAGQLRRQVIHTDANEANVLVGGPDNGSSHAIIAGLLDFGDSCVSWLANELAITALYMALEHLRLARPDPLAASAAVLRGYIGELPLLPEEWGLLRTLMMGRLAQSLSLGAKAAAENPANADYVLQTQLHGWAFLRLLWSLSEADFLAAVNGKEC